MATSGSITTGISHGRSVKLSWERTSYSIANNTSTIKWTLKGAGSGDSWIWAGPFSATIDGDNVYTSSARIKLEGGHTIASGSKTIKHTSDGTRSFTLSCKAAIYAEQYNVSASGTHTLNTIPRTSHPSCPSSGTLGVAMTISTNRKSTAFTHTITASYHGRTATITKVGASVSWTPPIAWCTEGASGTCTITCVTYANGSKVGTDTCTTTLKRPAESTLYVSRTSAAINGGTITLTATRHDDAYSHKVFYIWDGESTRQSLSPFYGTAEWTLSTSLINEIPNATSRSVTMYLQTYYADTYIGQSSKKITLTVPASVKPTVTDFTLTPTPPYAKYQGYILERTTFSVSNIKTTPAYGSAVSTTVSGANPFKDGAITVTATDKRGRTASLTKKPSPILAYTPPVITVFTAERGDRVGDVFTANDLGTTLAITIGISINPLNNGNSKNVRLTWAGPEGSGTETLTFDSYSERQTIYWINFQNTNNYTLTLNISDDFNSIQAVREIPTAEVIMDFHQDGKHMAIGKVAQDTDTGFTSAWESTFEQNISANGTINKKNNGKIISQLGQSTTGGGYVGIYDTAGNEIATLYEYNKQGHVRANGTVHKLNGKTIVSQLGQSTTGGGYVGVNNPSGQEIGALYDYNGISYLKVGNILVSGHASAVGTVVKGQWKWALASNNTWTKPMNGDITLGTGVWIFVCTMYLPKGTQAGLRGLRMVSGGALSASTVLEGGNTVIESSTQMTAILTPSSDTTKYHVEALQSSGQTQTCVFQYRAVRII